MRSSAVGVSSAGASALYRYRALAAQHRWERRAVRTVLACGAGVVAAGVSVWWAGLVVAVLVFAGHAAYVRFRPGPLARWRRGALAERHTGRRLARLDPAGFHVLHDRALPDGSAQDGSAQDGSAQDGSAPATNLDHLVIGLTGIYAIVSRRFRWGTQVRVEQRRIWVGHRPVGRTTGVAARAANVVAGLLSEELEYEVTVTPMVVVHGARVAKDGVGHGGVVFQAARTIPRAMAGEPVIFTSAQVATIAAAAERLLPPMMEMLLRE